MTNLLAFRDNIKGILSRYDYIATPIMKGILALAVFISLKHQFGYMPLLGNVLLILALSCVCAFLSNEILVGISAVVVVLQSFSVSPDVAILALSIIIIFYSGYMRFSTKTGIIVFLVPICYMCHLTYVLPIVLAFLVGPSAIVPVAFGVILYYYGKSLKEYVNMLAAATEGDTEIQGIQYIISNLLGNKMMLLTIMIFACVIVITYAIYRSSFEHSWIISFFVGGFLNIVLFLIGSVALAVEIEIVPILIESIVGVLIAIVFQFGKGIVDYQRTELLQFEDDEYYYYVKAIPKMSVSESNKNIQRINSKTHN